MKRVKLLIICSIVILLWNYSDAQTAKVQIIHNCADQAANRIDVYINGVMVLDNLSFRTASSFLAVPSGIPVTIEIAPFNSISRSQSFYTLRSTFVSGSISIIVANGIVSTDGYFPRRPFKLSVFDHLRAASLNPNNTNILFSNGATDAPAISLIETSVPLGALATNVSYSAFAAKYLDLPKADYKINVIKSTGATSLSIIAPVSPVLASYYLPVASSGLEGQVITLVSSGFLNPSRNKNGPQFGLYIVLPSGGNLIPLENYNPNNFNAINVNADNFIVQQIKMFPNPASSILNIEIPSGANNISAKITDLSGRQMLKIDNLNSSRIDVSNLSNGIYVLNFDIDHINYIRKFYINK